MTMNTRITAVRTEFCRSNSSCRMSLDLSWLKVISVPSGKSLRNSSVTAFTSSTVWIRFAPDRLETSIATAGTPFRRVTVSGSFSVGRISAMSRTRTVAVPVDTTGRFATSSIVSRSDGTLIA